MSYRKGFNDPLDLPRKCPVCDERRTDPAAVATHNAIAASTGCRKYPERRAYA